MNKTMMYKFKVEFIVADKDAETYEMLVKILEKLAPNSYRKISVEAQFYDCNYEVTL